MDNGRKKSNGWLVGVVVGIFVCFILLMAETLWLVYLVDRIEGEGLFVMSGEVEYDRDDDEFKDAFEYHYDRNKDPFGFGDYADEVYGNHNDDDNDYDYGYGDDYGYDYDYGYGDDYGYGYDYGYGNDYDYDHNYDHNYDYDHDYDYGRNDDYNHNEDYDYNYGYDPTDSSQYSYIDEKTGEEYYKELKDAIRDDLSYKIKWESYTYDTDIENVSIVAGYPVLTGGTVPNEEYLNEQIFKEVQFWVDSFEEYEEEGYFLEGDEFYMAMSGYVTYMDEEKMSIVFLERGESNGYEASYLYSINIDVQNGVVLENSSIIEMNDEFAVEFRNRNKRQNDAEGYIDELSDQEILSYLNSSTLGVVFYTPIGLEVGINFDDGTNDGWYTVTFKDYEKYLKKL